MNKDKLGNKHLCSNCGIKLTNRPIFSVQHHPEASPGPQDSFYLFDQFVAAMEQSSSN